MMFVCTLHDWHNLYNECPLCLNGDKEPYNYKSELNENNKTDITKNKNFLSLDQKATLLHLAPVININLQNLTEEDICKIKKLILEVVDLINNKNAK